MSVEQDLGGVVDVDDEGNTTNKGSCGCIVVNYDRGTK